MTVTCFAPASLTASRTQSIMGRPQMGWRTLGVRERMRVPRPAASMTAVRLGLRSVRLSQFAAPLRPCRPPPHEWGGLCQLAVALLAASACAASPLAVATPGAKGGGDVSPARTLSPSHPGAKGGSPPPIPGVPVASVRCVGQGGAAMVLVGRAIYDVTDPVHPKLVCAFDQ